MPASASNRTDVVETRKDTYFEGGSARNGFVPGTGEGTRGE